MKKILTAIALMVGLASPSVALMAQTEQEPINKNLIMVALFIEKSRLGPNITYVEYNDGACDGVGKFANFKEGMDVSTVTLDGPISTVTVGNSYVAEGRYCYFVAFLPKPNLKAWGISIAGQYIHHNEIEFKMVGQFPAMIVHFSE